MVSSQHFGKGEEREEVVKSCHACPCTAGSEDHIEMTLLLVPVCLQGHSSQYSFSLTTNSVPMLVIYCGATYHHDLALKQHPFIISISMVRNLDTTQLCPLLQHLLQGCNWPFWIFLDATHIIWLILKMAEPHFDRCLLASRKFFLKSLPHKFFPSGSSISKHKWLQGFKKTQVFIEAQPYNYEKKKFLTQRNMASS